MSAARRRVLLVDDEPSIVKMVGKRLEVEGFDVIVATDGQEAIAKAEAEHPDLIILDLMLPKLSGFDVCAKLKAGQDSKDIPIVVMFSGKGEAGDEERCRELGAAAYVAKGQGAGPLMAQVNALLGVDKQQR